MARLHDVPTWLRLGADRRGYRHFIDTMTQRPPSEPHTLHPFTTLCDRNVWLPTERLTADPSPSQKKLCNDCRLAYKVFLRERASIR